MKNTILLSLILLITMATSAMSITRYVPSQYDTIEDAVAASSNGDIIEIAPGTYKGYEDEFSKWHAPIDPKGKNLTFTSQDPNDSNIVDSTIIYGHWYDEGEGEDFYYNACYFGADEGPSCELLGLTILSGFSEGISVPVLTIEWGNAAIQCDNSSPTIRKCRIVGGSDGNDTYGIHCINSDTLIEDCTIKVEALMVEEGVGVVTIEGDSDVTIRNCTISDTDIYWGESAIYCISGSVTIDNCTISDNVVPTVLVESNDDYNITITNCTIKDNWDAIDLTCGSYEVVIQDCNLTGNDGTLTIYSANDVLIQGCNITGSIAGGSDAALQIDNTNNVLIQNCKMTDNIGGAISIGDCNTTIDNCTITDNESSGDGGGIAFCPSGWYYDGEATVSNCLISGNIARYGGGIFNWWSSWSSGYGGLTVKNCKITGNKALQPWYLFGGGGIASQEGPLNVINCEITGNKAFGCGGGIEVSSFEDTRITNCTIANNFAADDGGGIYESWTSNWDIYLKNCIIWANKADGDYDQMSVAEYYTDINYCDIQDSNGSGPDWGYPSEIDGGYNIDVDPCFVEAGYWVDVNEPNTIVEPNDPNAVWVAGDYHLQPNSACINKGDPNEPSDPNDYNPYDPNETDIDGEPRVMEEIVDMGSDEAVSGRGIYILSGSPIITNCKIKDNGYGIQCIGGEPVVKNNWIYENTTGIALSGSSGPSTIRNNTTVDNLTAGIYVYSGNEPNVTNCIVWDNGDDLYGCTATYSCISDCNDVGDPNITHNICDDPNFVDHNNNDYHLDPNSPCIDAGDPNQVYTGELDIDFEVRVMGDDVEMGADEYDPNS